MSPLLNSVLTIVVTLLIIGFLIFIHELGHFLAARSVGIKVDKFGLGFGPIIFRKQYGETEFSLRLFFLGGFVQMRGDDDPTSTKTSKDAAKDPSSYMSKTPLQKIWVTTAGILMNSIFGVIAFSVYLLIVGNVTVLPKIGDFQFLPNTTIPYVAAVYTDINITEGKSEGFITKINGTTPQNRAELIEILEKNYDKALQVELFDRYKVRSENLILNGEGIKSNLDLDLLSAEDDSYRVVIGEIAPGSALETAQIVGAGVTVGENTESILGGLLLKVAGEDITTVEELREVLEANLGKQVSLEVFNGGKLYELSANLPDEKLENGGILGANQLGLSNLGVSSSAVTAIYSNGLLAGPAHAVNILAYQAYALPYLISQAFQGRPEQLTQNVGSVVLVGNEIGNILSVSSTESVGFLVYIINLMGAFSLALAFMNILPIPLFDGGHILFIVLEKLRGKPLPERMQEWIYRIFFVLLILLGVLVIGKDVVSLINR